MVSSGSTNSVWPLELAPWMTPSSLRRWPAITGTTKRSLRMVTNSSCSTPSSRCAFRKRSSDSWMAFFCRSMSRRRRASATLAWSETLPSGRILPSRSFSSARKSPMVCARRPRRGKRSAAAVSSDLASAARSSSAKISKISRGSRLAPFDAQLVHGRLDIRQAGKVDADRGAARGRLRARGQPQILDGLAGFGQVFFQPRAVAVRLHLFQLAASQRARDEAAQTAAAEIRIRELRRWSSSRAAHFQHIFSAVSKSLFNHAQGAFGDLQRPQIAPPDPFHAAYVVARAKLAAGNRGTYNRSARNDIREFPACRA